MAYQQALMSGELAKVSSISWYSINSVKSLNTSMECSQASSILALCIPECVDFAVAWRSDLLWRGHSKWAWKLWWEPQDHHGLWRGPQDQGVEMDLEPVLSLFGFVVKSGEWKTWSSFWCLFRVQHPTFRTTPTTPLSRQLEGLVGFDLFDDLDYTVEGGRLIRSYAIEMILISPPKFYTHFLTAFFKWYAKL